MSTDKDLLTTWTNLGHKILSSVLVDNGAIFPVHEIIGAKVEWFPPPLQPVYKGILKCLENNIPPTVEALTLNGNGIAPAYLKTIVDNFNDEDNQQLIYHTEQLKSIGILAEVRKFGRDLARLDNIDDVSTTANEITNQLGGILSGITNRDNDAQHISDIAWQSITEKQGIMSVPTGMKWFDDHTGGLWPGMNYQIVAAYKQGKSTLMRNCVLYAASLNNPVGVFCAEGNRELFTLDCQAMLATQLLVGKEELSGRLSGLNIKRYYWQQGVFSPSELEAINEAREIWNGLPVFIWDSIDNIRNLLSLRYLIKRAKIYHSCTSFWFDYSQLFGEGGTLFERQSSTALTIQEIAQTENVALCMLNQKNEEGIRNKGGYSPSIKGGGDAAATADFLLVPSIDPDVPNVMNVELKLSRHTSTTEGTHRLAKSSGLMLRQ